MQITVISHLVQPKYRPKFTVFSTSELCGTDEERKSTSFNSKGRSREFLGTFFGKTCEACLNAKQENTQEMKKVPAIARHEGRQGCAEKASAVKFMLNKQF